MNKETAFAEGRRTAVALHGLLPPHVSTLDEQVDRMLRVVRKFETHLERYLFLRELQDSNEILFLRELYPKVHVSLHAGGLAPCVVPPEGLCCHVRMAVEQARTHRIGHGTDVMYEDDPAALMADKGVLVEINLTSNADVLGVSGKDHPFPIYRKFAVPVALSTDDEGIERIDLTNEYVRAVETYDLTYADLKQIVRNGLEYDFLPGASLWDGSAFQRIVSNCRGDALGAATPSPSCAAFLKASDTIVGGLILGLSRSTIVEFSFLLAVPTMLAATLYDLYKNAATFAPQEFGVLAAGFICSFVVPLLSIKFLLAYVRTNTFIPFGIYRILVALAFAFL